MIRIFRYEWVAWLVLVGLLASAAAWIPRLRLEFSFRESFRPDHPARRAYEEYENTFRLGTSILVVLSGPDVFGAEFLAAVDALTADLEDLPGTRSVLSALQIREPSLRGGNLSTVRPLGPRTYRDPAALARVLADPGLADRWSGLLFDRAREHFVVLITPGVSDSNPIETDAYMTTVEALVARHLGALRVTAHWGGMFFVNQEILRTISRDQGFLTVVSTLVITLLMALLFGRLLPALMVMGLLVVADVLGFLGMVCLDLPLNYMSGNLPLMIGVIGIADVIHVLATYSRLRRSYRPRGAAIRAARRVFLPNLLTTITTVGCVMVTAASPLKILETFSLSLSLGVVVVYLVTIVYGPLLLQRSGIDGDAGLYFRLQERLRGGVAARWVPRMRSPWVLVAWGGFTAACLALTAHQRINSNWFRNFSDRMPVSRSLDYMHRHGLGVSTVQLTLDTHRRVDEVLDDRAFGDEVRRLEEALGALPGVVGVHSLLGLRRALDQVWEGLEWPPDLAPQWRESRRQATYRQYLSAGAFDQYYDGVTQQMRIVLATSLEDSAAFLELGRAVEAAVVRLAPRSFAIPDVRLRGHMVYWSEIMRLVSESYFRTLWGSLLVIFGCFLLVTFSLRHALLALIPNLLPVLAMFAAARMFGHDLNENFCTLAALTIGISVDDSLHLLYHYRRNRRRRGRVQASLEAAYLACGVPVLLTSACLMAGFILCVGADMIPIMQTGFFLTFAIFVALLADLTLMPALILRLDGDPQPGEQRGYGLIRLDGS